MKERLKISDVNFYWDMDFQSNFILDLPSDKRPLMALAGGVLHGDLYANYKQLMEEDIVELKKKKDFTNRDNGFSLNRCIRDNQLKLVKVYDAKKKKPMRAMPDIVNYKNDLIIDLKTYYIADTTPPDEGGVFLTHPDTPAHELPENTLPTTEEIPDGYEMENAWEELKRKIEADLFRKYKSQLNRYHEAYHVATSRYPAISIYVILYIKTGTYYHDEEYKGFRRERPKGLSID